MESSYGMLQVYLSARMTLVLCLENEKLTIFLIKNQVLYLLKFVKTEVSFAQGMEVYGTFGADFKGKRLVKVAEII